MTDTRPIAVFDFDGTLVHGDCFAAWLRWQLRSSLWRRALALLFAPFGLLMMNTKAWRVKGISAFVWIATLGLRDEAALLQCYERYFASVEDLDQWRIEPVCAHLHEHVQAGDRVVIATGAERRLAQTLWQHLGGPPVAWVASTIEPWLGGWVAHAHTIGQRKLAGLRAADFDPPYAFMASDSVQDLPILVKSARVLLVAHDALALIELRKRVEAAGMSIDVIDTLQVKRRV